MAPLRPLLLATLALFGLVAQVAAVDWPESTQTARPWTRWWWHGSAVDKANLKRLLEEYHRVGLGGVEVTCIYGVQGEPKPNRPYRSEAWREAIRYTLDEAHRLGMGVDLPAGSGWRMGDPDLPMELANRRLVLGHTDAAGGEPVAVEIDPKVTPQAVVARSADGEAVDLTERLDGNRVDWKAPPGEWRIDWAGCVWSGDRVKRPGPGGAGLNINPFWRHSVSDFLTRFDDSLEGLDGVRAQFHDSFEYDGDWQPEFFAEFAQRRGYRLEHHLPELVGDGEPGLVGRVKHDYRLTLDDLVREHLVGTWADWAHRHGSLARNQSHGSPANWLDLYAAVDIPEIESFGRLVGGDADLLTLKFAASAANVAGKRLVSAETATWLDEHFTVTLGQVKQMVDRQLLGGVNHTFYHGTAYSPADAAWPGWLFYASTQLNPQNPIWRDFTALNEYVTRVQSVLQTSRPDSDVLLYWPIADTRHDPRGLRQEFRVHNSHDWFAGRPIGHAAKALAARGVQFDYVSDRLLQTCEAVDGGLRAPGGRYAAMLVPETRHFPLETVEKLADLAQAGASVYLVATDAAAPTLAGLRGAERQAFGETERERFAQAWNQLRSRARMVENAATVAARVRREAWAERTGIDFLRRSADEGTLYFLVNRTDATIDAEVEPNVEADSAVLMDPATGRIGQPTARLTAEHRLAVRVQLDPGESTLLLMTDDPADAPAWRYRDPKGGSAELRGWDVDFVEGGPTPPEPFSSDEPRPWTESDDPAAAAFAGTARYACEFDAPAGASRCLLDLGDVLGSARVVLNGESVGTLLGPSYRVTLVGVRPAGNRLEIDVTGVAANRIRDLDRRGVRWRIFEDINLVNSRYRPFDASDWKVRPLGLSGPVTVAPLENQPRGAR